MMLETPKEGTLGSRMMLKTAVSQEHHNPKTRASGCAGTVQIGLIVAIRHNASWQPPQAYNKLFARGPSTLSTERHRTGSVERTHANKFGFSARRLEKVHFRV